MGSYQQQLAQILNGEGIWLLPVNFLSFILPMIEAPHYSTGIKALISNSCECPSPVALLIVLLVTHG